VTIKNARFLGCQSYAIRVEAEGDPSEHADAQTNHLFQNNFFDGQPLNFDCHDPGCVLSGITVRFNTIVSGISLTDDCKLDPDRTCTVTGNRLYGNIVAGSCPSNAAAYGLGWSQSYNLWSGSGGPNTICAHDSTSIYGNKAKLVAPGPPRFDDHLATHSQRALGLVPPQVTAGKPVTDIDGDLRPGRFSADAGADEWDSALMVLGRSIGGVRLGEREQDLLASYGQPNRRATVSAGGARVTLLTYRLHGASLWVYTEGKRVVGIGTSSRYYALPTGVGVGGDAKLVRNWPDVSWLQCRRALRRVVGGTEILVSIPGGRNGATIGGITMVQKKFGLGTCASRR
jgi:hypothetical protein